MATVPTQVPTSPMPARDVVAGAASGFVATVPMSLAMEAAFRRLPWRDRYALPPREITENLERTVLGTRPLSDDQEHVLTWFAHLGYGTAMGALYGLAAPRATVAGGVAYGLAVWTVSYLGILPAPGLFRPATREPARRVALMVGAHVVWGAALGAATRALRRRSRRDVRSA